jgi:hypothetical protein
LRVWIEDSAATQTLSIPEIFAQLSSAQLSCQRA